MFCKDARGRGRDHGAQRRNPFLSEAKKSLKEKTLALNKYFAGTPVAEEGITERNDVIPF